MEKKKTRSFGINVASQPAEDDVRQPRLHQAPTTPNTRTRNAAKTGRSQATGPKTVSEIAADADPAVRQSDARKRTKAFEPPTAKKPPPRGNGKRSTADRPQVSRPQGLSSTREGRRTSSTPEKKSKKNPQADGHTKNDVASSSGSESTETLDMDKESRREDPLLRRLVNANMKKDIAMTIEDLTSRYEHAEEKCQTLEELVERLRKRAETTAPVPKEAGLDTSELTQDSFSGAKSKIAIEHIAIEWLPCITPETVCREDDECRPFKSPFRFCHWSPLAIDDETYLDHLRKAFVKKMVIQDTKACSDLFEAAYYRQKPTAGLKTLFARKRRNMKSDKIAKKVNQFIAMDLQDVEICNGSEWRLSKTGQSDSQDHGQCYFFTRAGASDLFDKVFSRSAVYAGLTSETRRILSLTQVAILDALFVDKSKKMKETKRNYGNYAQGTDKDCVMHAKQLAEATFEHLKYGSSQLCDCCLLVDICGAPTAELDTETTVTGPSRGNRASEPSKTKQGGNGDQESVSSLEVEEDDEMSYDSAAGH